MSSTSFEFSNPRVERIVSGEGSLAKLAHEVDRVGGTRALLVISPSVARTSLLEKITKGLQEKCVAVFDKVMPHSPTESIGQAVELARSSKIDVLISAGGGSAIDTGKGVA
ncbi:MAG: iron-containing alcohol dehydrogenase, partial [Dehalococcoidales bacterium]|nr:iron-containing alcohol dehydrogenase [Dehalococcoidales bacterium]